MKKLVVLILAVFAVSFMFTSCKKEEIIINTGLQVVSPQNPLPAELDENAHECWIENSQLLAAKKHQYACEENSENCGIWRTIEVVKYYGSKNGTRWIGGSTFTVVLPERTYYDARDLSDKVGPIKGYFGIGQNPIGYNAMRLWGTDHL